MFLMDPLAIQVILHEGIPGGIRFAEMPEWSGQIAVFPRDKVSYMSMSGEFECPGIYILVGEDQTGPGEQAVYVGETESLHTRIRQHLKSNNKTFWKYAILLKSSSGKLNKAHIKRLESDILRDISLAGVARITNQVLPPKSPHLSPHDTISTEKYLRYFQIILKTLGFNFFDRQMAMGVDTGVGNSSIALNYINPIFEIITVGAKATGRMIGRDFVVSKSSTFRYIGQGMYGAYASQLINKGILLPINPPYYELQRDTAFASHSLAASLIAGSQRSGGKSWKILGTIITFDEWEKSMSESLGFKFEYDRGTAVDFSSAIL